MQQNPKVGAQRKQAAAAIGGAVAKPELFGAEKSDEPCKSRPRKLLLVDDDIVDRKAITRLLRADELGFVIDEAKSRSEALECVDRETYECVLLDFRLGEANALELLPRLKQSSVDGRMAIVLITGMGNEFLAAQAFKAGVHDYIVKSNLHADILIGAIEHAIQSVSLERENEKQRAELEFFGLHDHLTGLPNRKLFFDRLDQALLHAERKQGQFCVCSMDLDRFKQINDTLGHAAGDAVIREVSRRLQEVLRSTDTVARLGGDEFVALLDNLESPGAISVADKLIDCILKPVDIDELQVAVGISIGISCYPKHGGSARELLQKADAAMYEAKNSSRGIVVYSADSVLDDQRAVVIATEISNIVDSQTLELEYQPKVDLHSLEIIGAEALVRWRHPSLGLLPPVEFIPAVERTQTIKPMTYHIAEQAIKQCACWLEQGLEVPIAVNLSAKILDSADLPDKIASLLERWSLPFSYLTLEVTETGALASQRVAADILYELSMSGVNVSIDDFGSGYTSFRYLRDFTIHELKIDRMFVDDLVKGGRDESIIKSMIELGKGFGVKVIAEGIEDQHTLDILKSLDCKYGQGYYFGRPMPPNQYLIWATQWAVDHAQK